MIWKKGIRPCTVFRDATGVERGIELQTRLSGGVMELRWVNSSQCRRAVKGFSVLVQESCYFLELRGLPRVALRRAVYG
jgi:hypothetical protein